MFTKDLKSACIITPTYPDRFFIERGAFVEYLVRIWIEMGMNVDVVAPRSIPNIVRSMSRTKQTDVSFAGNKITYPTYLSVSNKNLGFLDLESISRHQFLKASGRGLKKVDIPDFYYGKFLMRGGKAAMEAGKHTNRPAFVDIGEHLLLEELSKDGFLEAKKIIKAMDGIACVSNQLASEVIHLGARPDRVFVYPNTADMKRFYPMDQQYCRKQLGLPLNIPIVIFVGHFIERKGPLRVLSSLNDPRLSNVKGIFIGRGSQKPTGNNVLHEGPVLNWDLPMWLNAADLFVLPTQNEGHCNAINEAMACGLPIISSDILEIRDQVSEDSGILVNPNYQVQLVDAISKVIEDSELRHRLGKNGAQIQKRRSSVNRATEILQWIKNLMKTK